MSTLPASADMPRVRAANPASTRILGALVAPATAIVLLALALMLLFSQAWVHFALSASGGAAWLGSAATAYQLSDRTIAELLLGPATFVFADPSGAPFYTADEAAHLRDVRLVLYAFLALATLSAVIVGWAVGRRGDEPQTWRAIAHGGALLAGTLVVLGAFAALAFGVAFELFHRVLFPGGNWAFAADSNLVRLYPLAFWQLSTAALGVLGIALGAGTWLLARWRAGRLEAAR